METQIELTQAQRRMVVEHFAEECATDLPADASPEQEEQHCAEGATKLEEALGEDHLEHWRWSAWKMLVFTTRQYQSFDRDPEGWLYEMGWDVLDSVEGWKEWFDRRISQHIDEVAG